MLIISGAFGVFRRDLLVAPRAIEMPALIGDYAPLEVVVASSVTVATQ